MKGRKITLASVCISLFCFSGILQAQDNADSGLKWGGYLQTDNRLRLKDGDFSWQEYRLDLKAEVSPSELDKVLGIF
jgi:hypothetical protein